MAKVGPHFLRITILAVFSMLAFAANSVLARLALNDPLNNPGTFTLVRICAGAISLSVFSLLTQKIEMKHLKNDGSWSSARYLLIYAVGFSFAYVRLGAATGALVLFAVVQVVTFVSALRSEETLGAAGILGLVMAMSGLVALVGTGVSRPDPLGVLLMSLAGVAWAGYTFGGRGVEKPVLATTGNFIRAVPMATGLWLVLLLLERELVGITVRGIGLAVLSGAIASGLGYAIWYTVLPSLTRIQSGVVQLSPAPLSTIGGLVLIGEPITQKIIWASLLIMSGVLIGMLKPASRS